MMDEETLKEQQMEALKELYNYNQKLIPAIESMVVELRESKQADTDDLLKVIINGINWVIEVLNLTIDLVNEEEEVIDKARVNENIQKLGNAISEKDELKISESFEKDVIPFILALNSRVAVITKSAS